jgi:hypothetical protein
MARVVASKYNFSSSKSSFFLGFSVFLSSHSVWLLWLALPFVGVAGISLVHRTTNHFADELDESLDLFD